MPLDPRIPLGATQNALSRADPMDRYAKMMQMQNAQEQMQMRREDRASRNAMRETLAGGGDLEAAARQSGDIGAVLGVRRHEQQMSNMQLQQEAAKLSLGQQKMGAIAKLLRGAQDQRGWDGAIEMYGKMGGDISEIPTVFDPGYRNQALASIEEVMTQYQQAQLGLQERQLAANVANQQSSRALGWANLKERKAARGELRAGKAEENLLKRKELGLKIEKREADLAKGERELRGKARKAADAHNMAMERMQALRTNIGKAKDASGFFTTGYMAKLAEYNPLTYSSKKELDAYLNSVRAAVGMDEIKQMRDSSKSGASGLGQITQMELTRLEGRIATLDPAMGEAALDQALTEIESMAEQAWGRINSAYKAEYGAGAGGGGAEATYSRQGGLQRY